MTKEELMKNCFYYLNSFKRHRALALIKRNEGKLQECAFDELKMYQFIDSLELGLRAIQKDMRVEVPESEEE